MALKAPGEISAQVHTVHTVHDAVVATFEAANAAGVPIKAMAAETRIAGSRLYEIYEGKKHLWADEVPALTRVTGSSLIVATIARACGGTFVPLPTAPSALATDLRLASNAMHEFAQTIQAFSEALADGRITQAEAERIAGEGHEAIAAILALMHHAQERAVPVIERRPA